MKICIDGLGVTHLMTTGIGVYTYELLNGLFEMYPQATYELLWNKTSSKLKCGKNIKVNYNDLNINRKENNLENLEKYILNNKINIYHSPNNGFSIPKNKVCYYITTVQDVLPIINSKDVDEKFLKKFHEVFENAMNQSDRIIAVSEYVKEILRNNFNIPEKKIAVIYPGYSDMFKKMDEESCENILKSKYKIQGDYILTVGSLHKRKNLENLIKGFKEISLYSHNKLKLVLVGEISGKRRDYYIELMMLIDKLDLVDSIIFTGSVDYNDMVYFYSGAKCVINLSRCEGFSLSTIEAMACKTPVLCNEQTVFKEILGDTGVWLDANDKNNIVQGINEVLYNNNYKNEIIIKQSERVKKYNWSKSIIKTVHEYETWYD